MTETTDVTSADTMPEGDASPPGKPRLPAAVQLVGGITFAVGALVVACIAGVLLLGAYTTIERLIRTGTFRIDMEMEWGALAALLVGVVLVLAGRGMLGLKKAWRVLVLVAQWLTAGLLLYLLIVACREVVWGDWPLSWETTDVLQAAAPLLTLNLIMIALLTCRSTTEAFGGTYSRVHRSVVWTCLMTIGLIATAALVALLHHRGHIKLGLPL